LREQLEALPHGIGSGFANPAVVGNVFVFCMRMGTSDRVWFRNVHVDSLWQPVLDGDGPAWKVEDDTLSSLVAADPGTPDCERVLTDEAFRGAYEAWAIARDHAHDEWMAGTDPNALASALPKAFRDAAAVALEHGAVLGQAKQIELVRRLKSVPSVKAARAMRQALSAELAPAEQLAAISDVLDQFGIQPAEKVEPLPSIRLDEVRLVAWMAVQGTKPVPSG
jgi:hypothetical protein